MMTSHKENNRRESNNVNRWNPLAAIFRCWRWALPIGIVLAGITAFLMVISFQPKYRASAILERNSDYVVFEGMNPETGNLAESESDLLFNSIVLDPVLSERSVRDAPSLVNPEDADANLRDNLSVTSGGTESLMILSYEDTDPEAAARVCNAIVDSYLRQRDSFDNMRVNNLERWLEPELRQWEMEVQSRLQRVARLSERFFGYDPGNMVGKTEFENGLILVKTLQSRFNEGSIKIEILDAQIALDENNDDEKVDPESDTQESEPEIDEARTRSVKRMIRKRELLAAELQVLKARWSKERSRLTEFGGESAELQFAENELAVANDVLTRLRARIAAIRTERRGGGAIRLLAAATPPVTPVNSLPIKRIVGVSTAAFLVPFVLGFLFGANLRPETSDEDVDLINEGE